MIRFNELIWDYFLLCWHLNKIQPEYPRFPFFLLWKNSANFFVLLSPPGLSLINYLSSPLFRSGPTTDADVNDDNNADNDDNDTDATLMPTAPMSTQFLGLPPNAETFSGFFSECHQQFFWQKKEKLFLKKFWRQKNELFFLSEISPNWK